MATNDKLSGTFSYTPDQSPNAPEGTLAGTVDVSGEAASVLRQAAAGPHEVTLQRSSSPPTADQLLWTAIRNRTDAIGFTRYGAFIQRLLCERAGVDEAACQASESGQAGEFGMPSIDERLTELMNRPGIYGVDAYQLLRLATQAFLLFESGVAIRPPRGSSGGQLEIEEASRLGRPITLTQTKEQLEQYLSTQIGTVGGKGLPYLKRVVDALIPGGSRQTDSPFCENMLRNRLHCPALIELIYNFWLEQAGVMQTMNAVLLRFQNRRRGAGDPLTNLAIDPLRSLSMLLWGRVQAEPQQLSVSRRAHEYRYAYGLTLQGRAVADVEPAESRTQFLEAFHDLLHEAAEFYEADAITTVRADAFSLLQRLKELHLVLADAANNQWNELKRQAREELLVDQYLLSRPEMREFLRGRVMVPYAESWMGQVDEMKRLQGWLPQLGVSHFHTLATTSEQLLLAIRFGDWTQVIDQASAINWARYWKPEVQSYMHAYQVISGVNLSADVSEARRAEERYLQPSVHLRRRMQQQAGRSRPAIDPDSMLLAGEMVSEPAAHDRARLMARIGRRNKAA